MAPGTLSRYQAKSSPPRLWLVADVAVVAEHALDGPAEQHGRAVLVDDRRHAADVGDRRLHAVGLDDLADRVADQLLGLGPRDGVEHPDGAAGATGVGDDVDAEPARTSPTPR